MESYIEGYATALQIPPFKKSDIRREVWEPPDESIGDWRTIGAEIKRKRILPDIREWGAMCCVCWGRAEPKLYCWIGEWYWPRRLAERFAQKARGKPSNFLLDDFEVGLLEALNPEDAANFEGVLESLAQQWIELWKKVGGMKKVFKE